MNSTFESIINRFTSYVINVFYALNQLSQVIYTLRDKRD